MAAAVEQRRDVGHLQSSTAATWDVDNNVWLVGDEHEVLVIDAAHDAAAILAAVGERRVVAVVCTHGHNDHINAAVEVAAATDAAIALHPADTMLWEQEYDDLRPDLDLADGGSFDVAGTRLAVLHTPGHSPGAVCALRPGPGCRVLRGHPVPGRSWRDRPVVQRLPHDHRVDPRRAADAAAAARSCIPGTAPTPRSARRRRHLQEWIDRGH